MQSRIPNHPETFKTSAGQTSAGIGATVAVRNHEEETAARRLEMATRRSIRRARRRR